VLFRDSPIAKGVVLWLLKILSPISPPRLEMGGKSFSRLYSLGEHFFGSLWKYLSPLGAAHQFTTRIEPERELTAIYLLFYGDRVLKDINGHSVPQRINIWVRRKTLITHL
jgi:hypothetical protein